MRSDPIHSAFDTHCLRLIGCLAALMMPSEAGAGVLFSRSFAAGGGPQSVAVADLDGDSVPDLVTANERSDDVSVLLGNGDGSFQAAVSFAAGDLPLSVASADLDGDSVPDLVTANGISDDVSVLLGNGDGTLQPAAAFLAGDLPGSLAVADLDGDTALDLATANEISDDVTVLINLPEPSQFLLAAAAFATLAWLRRKSNSRVSREVR